MDLRRERKKENHIIGILLIMILLCIGAIAIILVSRYSFITTSASVSSTINFGSVDDIDTRAVKAKAGILAKFKKQNEPDQFSYEIKKNLVFSDTNSEAELLLKNPKQNGYLMVLELVLEDSQEVILRTGYLLPGQIIKNVALDEELSSGEYKVVANICAVDAQSYELVGILEQPLTVVVES